MEQPEDEFMDTVETAGVMHCSTSSLAKKRCTGDGPPFIRLSPRKILYRRDDVIAWLEARRHNSTSSY